MLGRLFSRYVAICRAWCLKDGCRDAWARRVRIKLFMVRIFLSALWFWEEVWRQENRKTIPSFRQNNLNESLLNSFPLSHLKQLRFFSKWLRMKAVKDRKDLGISFQWEKSRWNWRNHLIKVCNIYDQLNSKLGMSINYCEVCPMALMY